jgi:hypothetical protein
MIPSASAPPPAGKPGAPEAFQLLYFADLLKRRICAGTVDRRVGRVTDLVFKIAEPYPEAVGIYIAHEFGRHPDLIPWNEVTRLTTTPSS